MEWSFDGFTFGFLLLPQVALVALVPFAVRRGSADPSTGTGAHAGLVVLFILGCIGAAGVATVFTMFIVGMSNGQPIAPLAAALLRLQIAVLFVLLVLALLAAGVAPQHRVVTLGLRELAIMAGLVPFWFVVGLAPGELAWPIVLLTLVLGATAGLAAGFVVAGSGEYDRYRDRLTAAVPWAVGGAVGVAVGFIAAYLAGALSPYAGLQGPPPLSDQLETLLPVVAAVGAWLGLSAIAAASLTDPLSARRAVLAKGLVGELLLLVVGLASWFALQRLYPTEYTAHLAPAANYAVAHYPNGIATADINGDGQADVVVWNDQFSTWDLLLGNGDGTLMASTDCGKPCASVSTVGYRPEATEDFNGDGRQDKVQIGNVGSYPLKGGVLMMQLNTGDAGTAGLREAGKYRVGREPRSMVVADLNGDSQADLVVANTYSNELTFLLGSGDGTFRPGGSALIGESPVSVGAGDLNGDGKPDIVAGTRGEGILGNVSVLLSR